MIAPPGRPRPQPGAVLRLRAELDNLTPALGRVARYAAANPELVVYQSVTELAELSGAGEASVIRMCRDLGYAGFQEFKLALAADLSATEALEAPEPEGTRGLVASALHGARYALEETAAVLDPLEVDRVVEAVLSAPRVEVYGVGASGVTAQDFAYKFLRLGLSAQALTDPHLAAMAASNLPAGAVAIGISRSGSTVDTLRALELARAAGAFTVALTHRARSPLASADAVLHTSSPESPLAGGAVTSKVGQLLVLDVLFTALLARLPGAREAAGRTAAAVADRNY